MDGSYNILTILTSIRAFGVMIMIKQWVEKWIFLEISNVIYDLELLEIHIIYST